MTEGSERLSHSHDDCSFGASSLLALTSPSSTDADRHSVEGIRLDPWLRKRVFLVRQQKQSLLTALSVE